MSEKVLINIDKDKIYQLEELIDLLLGILKKDKKLISWRMSIEHRVIFDLIDMNILKRISNREFKFNIVPSINEIMTADKITFSKKEKVF